MKKQTFFIVVAVSLISITATRLFWPSSSAIQVTTTDKKAHVVKEAKVAPEIQLASVMASGTSTYNDVADTVSTRDSALFVASAYAAELSYPPYSQPLAEADLDRLQPNYFNPQSIPVDDEGNTITATLSKYRYLFPEPITASLSGYGISAAQLDLVDMTSNKVLTTASFEYKGEGWQAKLSVEANLPPQIQVVVRAQVGGKTIPIVLALKYLESVATLEGFEPAQAHDADMLVKANITANHKGLYRLRANLFDMNHKPIAHLTVKARLDVGEGGIELKAHQSVLMDKQGPFYLKTFVLELMSPQPGVPTRFGSSELLKFEINDFVISSLSTTPYQPSEQEVQRLKLLENMASGN